MDPGSSVMIWQVSAIAVLGSLFCLRRLFGWVSDHLGFRSTRIAGFLFATLFALIACPLTLQLFEGHPLPRFNDLFLVGIVLTAYLFTWEASIYLLVISLLVSAWVLPPGGSFAVMGFTEWYRFASFAVVSIFLIFVITRLKARPPQSGSASEHHSFRLHGAAAGAD